MYFLYNIIILLFGVLSSPYVAVKAIVDKRFRKGLKERFGFSRGLREYEYSDSGQKRFWVHAASVGEVNVAYPFIKALLERYDSCEVVLTAVTPEGYDLAHEKLKGVAKVFFAPLDYSVSINRFLNKISPGAVFIIETEIWPNMLRTLSRQGIKVGIVNGRISERSFKRYKMIGGFTRSILKHVDFFLMQEEEYKTRLTTLLGSDSNIKVTGNIKFDIDDSFFKIDGELIERMREVDYIVAASTHDDEEKKILTIYKTLKARDPSLKLVLAPRHIQRCSAVEALLRDSGLRYIKRSAMRSSDHTAEYDVLFVDTIGDLVTFFTHAKLVFIGGSLANIGGHNILEPAHFARPIIFGPNMQNFTDAKELLLAEGGAVMVANEKELAENIAMLLRDENLAMLNDIGNNAKAALMKNKGALEKTLLLLLEFV